MMKNLFVLLFLTFAVVVNAAQIKDVKFICDAKKCEMGFQFASEDDLPTFFQKYDASAKKLTVGFSNTEFALGEGSYDIDAASEWVKSMRVFKDNYRGMQFLKIEMSVGPSLSSDKNEISLDGANFLLKLKGNKGKAWTLSKIFAQKKKEADKRALEEKKAAEKQAAEDKKAAEKAALEEKKRLAEEKKAAEKQAIEDKKAAAKAAAEEKKRLAEEKKAAEKQALEDKKAAAKAAAEEKKRLAEEKKAAEKAALEEKKRLAEEEKAAKKAAAEEAKRLAEEQKNLDKAIKEGGAISALLPGVKEFTVLMGSGMEQFRLVTDDAIDIKYVSGPDKASIITVGVAGPQKSPVFKIGAGSLVKSATWGANGLKLQLPVGLRPVVLVQDGALVLQTTESAIKKDGFIFWSARPDGIFVRDWMKAADASQNFDSFVNKYYKDSKKIVSGAQVFHLKPVVRELIVVEDEIDMYAGPNDNSQVINRLTFGDRLVNMDLVGLYYKVQSGARVGFVNRRSVSYKDELSAVQQERLKQVDKERGELSEGSVTIASQLDGMYEDRVTYSSFGRRDPFVEVKGLVEEGINIDQVELVGIIWESDVPMAILVEAKNPSISYTLKEGDKILNGKVLKITETDVLFLIQEFGVSRRYSMGLPDKYGGKK
jgi:chemotaxis protein histidine kinase CheA